MRAARAGSVLRGQRFAMEQILGGPALAAIKSKAAKKLFSQMSIQ